MRLLFNGAIAGNGFNSLGHYVRDEPLISSCTNYATSAVPGCAATFAAASAASSASSASAASAERADRRRAWWPRPFSRPRSRPRTRGSMQGLLVLPDGERAVRSRGRRDPGLAGNPVLIGALTVLVTIVAVYLAYNATNGLPFVPTYDAARAGRQRRELTHGDDVNMGGALVGIVSTASRPTRLPDGRPIALINLQLQKSIEPLPVDSKFTVRLKGAIGLKYLDITLGHSHGPGFGDNADGADAPGEHRGRLRPGAVDVHAGHAQGRPALHDRLRPGPGRPRAMTSTTRSARSCRCWATCSPWRATSRRRTPTSAASSAAWSATRARWPRWPRPRRCSSPTWTRTFRALAGGGVPSLQQTISADAAHVRGDDRQQPR